MSTDDKALMLRLNEQPFVDSAVTGSRCALLVPNHRNVRDSTICLGERAWKHALRTARAAEAATLVEMASHDGTLPRWLRRRIAARARLTRFTA